MKASESEEETARQSLEECVKNQRNQFNNYDQTVDVVSCWHSFVESVFQEKLDKCWFDRFPELENGLTPDFTILFDEEYGIIADVAHSINKEVDVLESKARQLKKYSEVETLRGKSGLMVKPKRIDTMLILNSAFVDSDSQELYELLKEHEDLRPRRPLIIMDYTFSQADSQSLYLFRKSVDPRNGHFCDDHLSDNLRLEEYMGKRRKPLRSPPDKFAVNKAIHLFCNDEPCPIYLAARLWDTVFIGMSTEENMAFWRAGTSTSAVPIVVTEEMLAEKITKEISPGARISERCIGRALKFLEAAGKATFDDNKWTIKYGNLKGMRPKQIGDGDGTYKHTQMREFGILLAELYCKQSLGFEEIEPEEEGDEEIRQAKLFEF